MKGGFNRHLYTQKSRANVSPMIPVLIYLKSKQNYLRKLGYTKLQSGHSRCISNEKKRVLFIELISLNYKNLSNIFLRHEYLPFLRYLIDSMNNLLSIVSQLTASMIKKYAFQYLTGVYVSQKWFVFPENFSPTCLSKNNGYCHALDFGHR